MNDDNYDIKKRLLGVTWGLFMIYQDLNNYLLYGLLLLSSPEKIHCHNFLKYYTLFTLISTILTGIFYPISGWIIDNINKTRNTLVLIWTLIAHLFIFVLQIVIIMEPWSNQVELYINNWILLCILYQIFQILTIFNNNLLWKIIKKSTTYYNHMDYLGDESIDLINHNKLFNNNLIISDPSSLVQVNKIGNMGDLTSDSIETIVLIIITLLLMFYDKMNFYHMVIYFSCWIIIILFISLILMIKLHKWLLYDLNFNFDLISINSTKKQKIKRFLNYLKKASKNFYLNKIGFHALWHCLILGIYSAIIQYLLTFKEIDNFVSHSSTSSSEDNRLNNFCDYKVVNLIILGSITNGSYLVGSCLYKFFIVKTPPSTFYKYWYPVAILILIGSTTSLWFNLPDLLILFMISISQIIPYYLTYYDYYLFTERTDEKSYGFILGIYGVGSTLISVSMQILYLYDVSFLIILIGSSVLLGISLVYSYYLAFIYQNLCFYE